MSSSYKTEIPSRKKLLPKFAIDGELGTFFSSFKEMYPWISIDWETPREVDGIIVYLPSGSISNFKNIDVRVGYEAVGATVNQILTTNPRCNVYGGVENDPFFEASYVNISCDSGQMLGRFLTLQRLEFGFLELYEVEIYPKPVDGGWSTEREWGDCSLSCANGTKTAKKFCNNPSPVNGGMECYGSDEVTIHCNDHPCPGRSFGHQLSLFRSIRSSSSWRIHRLVRMVGLHLYV